MDRWESTIIEWDSNYVERSLVGGRDVASMD